MNSSRLNKLNPIRSIMLMTFVMTSMGCGKPCEKLEEKLCSDLGEADCKVWQEKGKPGLPKEGRRLTKQCTSALGRYDAVLTAAKTVVKAYKTAAASQGKAKAANCNALETRLCKDLGEERCAKWKANGKPGMPDSGMKCKMAKSGLSYKVLKKKVLKAAGAE